MLKGVLEPGKKYSELTSKCSSRIQDPTHDTRGDQECTNSPDSVTISITEYVQDNLPRVIRVCGVLDTHSSCLIHDFAYNTCYNPPQTGPGQPFSKIQADSNLRNGIRATCSAMFSTDPECLHECNSVADMFYSGVSLVNTFYEIDQIGACLCCNAIE